LRTPLTTLWGDWSVPTHVTESPTGMVSVMFSGKNLYHEMTWLLLLFVAVVAADKVVIAMRSGKTTARDIDFRL
jgi:hypothetical protein